MLCMAITFVSCSGEDGAQGIPGTNGLDGNANLQRFDIDIDPLFDGSNLQFDTPIDPQEIENYTLFFYLRTSSNVMYSIPGPLVGNFTYARTTYDLDTSSGAIVFYSTSDDSLENVEAGSYTMLKIVAIESLSGSNKGKKNIVEELKAAGVDTSDYQAVADYFGLE